MHQCFHTLTSQPAPQEGFFPEPSSSPSSRSPWLPGNHGRCRCPWARRAGDKSQHYIQQPNMATEEPRISNINNPEFELNKTVKHSLWCDLTSNRLSPTSATSRLWPLRWRTMAAFSEAYMQVKSNMATSGWP